jgi:hypothetical protein
VSYGLTRVGGVLLIVFALIFGSMLIGDDRKQAAEQRAQQDRAQAEADFVAPPPESRGPLPVLGYFAREVPAGGFSVDLYYLAPSRSFPAQLRNMAESMGSARLSYPCYSAPMERRGDDGRITVDVELRWAPQELGDLDDGDSCRMGRSHKIERLSLGRFPAVPPIVTDMPIAAVDGVESAAAAPGNVVPKLTDKPDTNGNRATVSLRGRIPIVGYEISASDHPDRTGENAFFITYLRPEGADTHPGDEADGPRGGCEIIPTIRRSPDAVTIDLRLFWSNPHGYYKDEDDRRCVIGTSWSRPGTTSWGWVTGRPAFFTDGPVADSAGRTVLPANPGNRLPER